MQPANGNFLAPVSTRQIMTRASQVNNLLLRLYHYLPASLMNRGEVQQKHHAVKEIAEASANLLDQGLLQELVQRQRRLLESLKPVGYEPVNGIRLRLTSDLTCGLSTPSLLERGTTLLRPHGVPIIPGSSVKGAVAAHLAEVLAGKLHLSDADRDGALREAGLLELFGYAAEGGERGKAGKAIFLDAVPEAAKLRLDITTVHYKRYYEGKTEAATGFEAPVPLPFLAVGEGSVFWFPAAIESGFCLKIPPESASRLQQFEIQTFNRPSGFLAEALASTGKYRGFGAQTNVGFGRFSRFRP